MDATTMSDFGPSLLSRKRSSDTPMVNTDSDNALCSFPSSKTKLRVRIKAYHGVAKWTWNVGNGSDDEVCGICQTAFEGCPPGIKYPGDESPVVFGTCGHAFHLQCIATWLSSNKQTCPICRADWEYGGNNQGGAGGGNGTNDNANNDNNTANTANNDSNDASEAPAAPPAQAP